MTPPQRAQTTRLRYFGVSTTETNLLHGEHLLSRSRLVQQRPEFQLWLDLTTHTHTRSETLKQPVNQ